MEKIKLFLQKPLYKSIKVWHVLVVLIVLASFGESETKKTEQDEIITVLAKNMELSKREITYYIEVSNIDLDKFKDYGKSKR